MREKINPYDFLRDELPHIYNSDNITQSDVVQAMEEYLDKMNDK